MFRCTTLRLNSPLPLAARSIWEAPSGQFACKWRVKCGAWPFQVFWWCLFFSPLRRLRFQIFPLPLSVKIIRQSGRAPHVIHRLLQTATWWTKGVTREKHSNLSFSDRKCHLRSREISLLLPELLCVAALRLLRTPKKSWRSLKSSDNMASGQRVLVFLQSECRIRGTNLASKPFRDLKEQLAGIERQICVGGIQQYWPLIWKKKSNTGRRSTSAGWVAGLLLIPSPRT